jgi:hypothetical protein
MIIISKTISQQTARLKAKYPQFRVHTNASSLVVSGSLRPTARSLSYDFRVEYRLDHLPFTTIKEGQLIKNEKGENIPHMYDQESLCLFRSKYRQFTTNDLIADTIIPWTSLWLYHYENWHITGQWEGGGEHPFPRNKRKRRYS